MGTFITTKLRPVFHYELFISVKIPIGRHSDARRDEARSGVVAFETRLVEASFVSRSVEPRGSGAMRHHHNNAVFTREAVDTGTRRAQSR